MQRWKYPHDSLSRVAQPWVRVRVRGSRLGLGQVYPGLRNPGEAIMWVFPSLLYNFGTSGTYSLVPTVTAWSPKMQPLLSSPGSHSHCCHQGNLDLFPLELLPMFNFCNYLDLVPLLPPRWSGPTFNYAKNAIFMMCNVCALLLEKFLRWLHSTVFKIKYFEIIYIVIS